MGLGVYMALLLAVALVMTGCATSEQWAEWRRHPTHFASGHHLVFSLRNREGGPPLVARKDIEAARVQRWWGEAITVSPKQIFEE